MKTWMHYWWTGMLLVTLGSLPFRGVYALLDWLEPALVDGHRQGWWVFLGTAINFAMLIVVPLFVRFYAREIVRTEGWTGFWGLLNRQKT